MFVHSRISGQLEAIKKERKWDFKEIYMRNAIIKTSAVQMTIDINHF